jgi:hypothetical protein
MKKQVILDNLEREFLDENGYPIEDTRSFAEGGTRTLTELPPADFESAASTSSTTSALLVYI